MPYVGYNDHYGTGFPWAGLIATAIIFGGLLWIISTVPPSKQQLFNEGKITEEQYCQEYADWYRIPARCYKYFGIPVDALSK